MKDKRMARLRQFLEADPNDPFLHYAIGIEHLKNKNFEEASQVFRDIIEAFPSYVPTYYQYAITKIRLGDIIGAVEVIKKGIPMALEAGEKRTVNELNMLLEDLED